MAITKFRWGMGGTDESSGFGKKVWFKRPTDPADVEEFATRESSEEQVRKDYQNLFNQLQWYLNEKLTDEIELYVAQQVATKPWEVTMPDGSIVTAKLSDAAVNGTKLADNAVSSVKIVNSSVTTEKLADGAVTAEKIGSVIPVDKGGTGVTTLEALSNALNIHNSVVRVEQGSYVGQGRYGSSNKTAVALRHKPFMFWVEGMEVPMSPTKPRSFVRDTYNQYGAVIYKSLVGTYTEANKTFSWYSDGGNSVTQLDNAGTTYHYFALYTE